MTQLKPQTEQAFAAYMREAEARIAAQVASHTFLWVDASPDRQRLARQGNGFAEPWSGKGDIDLPDGLAHDWIGAVFIPGATLDRTLAVVQNYDGHKGIYKPEVVDSKTLARTGEHFTVYMRLLKKKVITVVLDTEHDAVYFPAGPGRVHSRSYSTRIAEVQDPGTGKERLLPPGRGHGFLWKLNTFWRFEEKDGGVWVECEAISLTRDVPAGLGWLINPIIRNLPKDSLVNTLRETRDAVLAAAR